MLLGLRAGLSTWLRPIVEARLSESVRGRITIADLEVSILPTGLVLHGVRVFPEAAEAAALISVERVSAQIAPLALRRDTLHLRELEVSGVDASLERLPDGRLSLPDLLLPEMPAPGASVPAFDVRIDRLRLDESRVHFLDLVVKSTEPLDVAVRSLELSRISLTPGAYAAPPELRLDAEVRSVPIRVEAVLRSLGEPFDIEAHLETEGFPVPNVQLYLPETGWSRLDGRADLRVDYQRQGERNELRGRITLHDLAIERPDLEGPALELGTLDLTLDPFDLARRRVRIGSLRIAKGVLAVAPRTPFVLPLLEGMGHLLEQAGGGPGYTWSVEKAAVEELAVRVLGAEPAAAFRLSASAERIAPSGKGFPVEIDLRDAETAVAAQGSLRLDPLGFAGAVRWSGLPLATLVAAAPSDLAPWRATGRTNGELAVESGSELRLQGRVAFEDLFVTGDDPALFGLRAPSVEVSVTEARLGGATRSLHLGSLTVADASVQVTRTAEGLALPRTREPEAGAAADRAPPLALAVDVLRVAGAEVSITDRTVAPEFEGELSELSLDAKQVSWPDLHVGALAFAAVGPDEASLLATGWIDRAETRIDASGELPLPPYNPYLSALSGLQIPNGVVSVTSRIKGAERVYDARNQVLIRELDVEGEEGRARFKEQFGVPLSLALAVLRDADGNIALKVPVKVDASGPALSFTSTLGYSMKRAILNAVVKPLKRVGSVSRQEDGRIESVDPEPLAFLPGRAELAEGQTPKLEQLTALLAGFSGLRVRLSGNVSPADVRWLAEQEVLAQMSGGGVLESVRGTLSPDERALRAALEARAAGRDRPLGPGQQSLLEQRLAAVTLAPERLLALADERAALAETILEREYAVPADHVKVIRARTREPAGEPGVRVRVLASRSATSRAPRGSST